MSSFTEPVQKLTQETRAYVDARIDSVKLLSTKALSQGTASLAGLLLLFGVVVSFLLILSFALIMLLGEALDSYAIAALIVAGSMLLILLILWAIRRHLFKNTFVHMYSELFFPKEETVHTMDELDKAVIRNEADVAHSEAMIMLRMGQAERYYSPSHLLGSSVRVIPTFFRILLGIRKRKSKR